MPRKTAPLTNTEVCNAKPRHSVYKLSDGHGLALRVRPNGTKSWLFNFIDPDTSQRKNLSFGIFPDVTLAQARQMRAEARGLVANNINPQAEREKEKQIQIDANERTLKVVSEIWFKEKKTKIANTTATAIWRSLENHLFPSLGDKPIAKITAPAAIKALEPLAAKGSLETTAKLISYFNGVMIKAIHLGFISDNPLRDIGRAFDNPKSQHMATLKPEELPELMMSLQLASIKITTRLLIEWQLHTMVRPSEAAGARWEEIDLDNKLWTIPPERMKRPREHNVPLTSQSLRILERMKPLSGHREHIFPADRKPNQPSNSQTANMALKRMGFKGRLVAHGMRSIASTTLNEKGFDPDVIESALAHIDKNEVRAAYNRAEYLERRTKLMGWWSEYIEAAARGEVLSATKTKTLRIVND